MFISLPTLLSVLLLLGDANPNSPPYRYDTSGGMTSPVYSGAANEASHFLNLLDQKAFAGSYGDSGSLIKDLFTAEEWGGAMEKARCKYGNLITRKVVSHSTSETLPHGTKGYFVTFIFNSTFSENKKAEEKVILMLTDKENWRVVGYSITPK